LAFHFHNADHPFRCPERKNIRSWLSDFAVHHKRNIHEVAVIFCSDEYLLEINRAHLDHDYYTDIITFDYAENDSLHADLFLSIDRIKENATLHKQLFFNELLRVIIHGHLHLVGYKDKTENEASIMREREDYWVQRYYQNHCR